MTEISSAWREILADLRQMTAEREVREVYGPAYPATPWNWQCAWLRKQWSA